MRNVIIIINLAILFGITSIFSRTGDNHNDNKAEIQNSGKEVSNAPQEVGTIQSNLALWSLQWGSNETDEANNEVSEEVAGFIEDMSDSRAVTLEYSRIATQRATKRPLKDYASALVKDQTSMLKELNAIAKKKKMDLTHLATTDAENINALKDVHGASFDKRFISMMLKDHKKNVKKLQKATRSSDADIQVFATKYLPVVEGHLSKIKALRNDWSKGKE